MTGGWKLGTHAVSYFKSLANVINTNCTCSRRWSYAIAKFLVSTLFRAFPGNPSNVSGTLQMFFSSIPFLFSVDVL